MKNENLEKINTYLNFIDNFHYVQDISSISYKINQLLASLNGQDYHKTEKLCQNIINNTDFEDILIVNTHKQYINNIQRIIGNCNYLIDRLILLAFNKISKHELGKAIDKYDTNLSIMYKLLETGLKNKNHKE